MSMLDNKLDESNEDDKLRANALKRLIDMMHKDEFSHDGDGPKRTRSLPADGNELDEISERANSYPLSPRTKKEMEDQLINPLALGFYRPDEAWEPQDNVYAESKPPDPFGKIGKTYKDGDTQTFMVGGDHDIPFRVDDNDDGRHPRTKGRVGRGRGKRSRFEEKIREENQFLDQDSDELDEDGELDVIKEEEDLIAAGIISGRKKEEDEEAERKRLEDDLRKKIEEEDNQLLEEEKRLATNKTEDDFIKEAEEELSKSKLDSASLPPHQSEKSELNDTEVNVNPVTVNSAAKNIDGMRIPPSHDKRTFNENDVKGELDRNEEGKYSPAVLPTGVMVDKYGRKVNEKGYLVDDDGNVIDCKTEKQMFEKDKLDPSGDIPQPFKLERYNFNPHDITGDFGFDRNDKPALNETPDGKLVDNSGRQVNEKGILVDEEGNVIDKYRRKKLDKDQLTNQGDLPMMLNYNGKQFKMQDVMGQFDKDPRGDIILEKDANGNMVDKKGRRVNDKGYLVDENGNIIDKKGNKVWDKDHLFENEFPKIFPFSTFNPETITGNFKRDKNGKPILKPADKEGQFYDDDGNLVNKQGYLINKDGDIIDKNGNLVFKKNILKDGEIPPVFRNGMIRQNSSTSLSRLMSEIDKNQDSDLDILKNQLEDFEEDKGNTSVDSLMEDTPSNYNIANQRFDERKYKKEPDAKYDEDEEDYYDEGDENEYEGEEDEDEDEEDNDSITGPAGVPILNARQPKSKILRKKKKKKRRKKKPKLEYEDPTAADKAMARAYGGAARGRMVRKPKRLKSGRSTSSHASRGFSKPARRDQFFHKAGGSVSGRDPSMKINTIRSDHSKGRVGKGPSLPSKAGTKKKTRGPISKASHSDFEKLYDKNLDDFLENSEFDFESIGPPSRTMSRQGSVRGDNRLKGLESIYLQRLEANPAKGKGKKGGKKRRGKKGDNDFLGSEISDQDDLAGLIEDNYRKMKNKFAPQSARGKKRNNAPDYNQPNIFTGNYTKYVKGSNGGDMDQL